jgi:hypothetical protein
MPADPVRVEPRDVSRIVLCDRLPARDLEIPSFAASSGKAGRTLKDFQGKPLIAWVGFADDPASRFVLRALAARKKDLDANGVPLLAIECGDAAAESGARKLFRELGVDALAGRADKRFLQDIQVFAMEVIGPFDRLAHPLTLLFDRGGRLAVLYSGVPRMDEVFTDARTTYSVAPNDSSNEALLHGRWASPYSRNLESMGQIFDLLGEAGLGRYYHGLAAERGQR